MSHQAGRGPVSGVRRDAVVVAVWSLAAGVLGAIAWWLLVDLPIATKYEGAVVLEPAELTREVGIDAWYVVIALMGGILGGLVLGRLCRRDPLTGVVLAVAGGVISAMVMLVLGGWLGPDDHRAVLQPRPDGASAPMELAPHAPGVIWVWPAAVAFGCLVRWWLAPAHGRNQATTAAAPRTRSAESAPN